MAIRRSNQPSLEALRHGVRQGLLRLQGAGMLWMLVILGCAALAQAQWTEPVPMEPQFGLTFRVPWISNDGLRLYLSNDRAIFVAHRDSVGAPWRDFGRLPTHINLTNTMASACESPSGDTLYFMSEPRPEGSYGSYDIYYAIRTDSGWGSVYNCGPNINGPGMEWSVTISRDGSMLLISSGGPQGGYLDLYCSRRQPDGSWAQAVHLGNAVNSWENEDYCSLSPDNTRLFFSRLYGPDSGEIYESRLVNGQWQPAAALPDPVNGRFTTEQGPCIDPDGRTLWFSKETDWNTSRYRIVTSIDTTVLNNESGRGGADHAHQHPSSSRLAAFPNPFNARTEIRFTLPQTGRATLTVYDLAGREVAVIADETFAAGEHSVAWNAAGLPSGVYFARLHAGEFATTRKLLLLR